MTGASCVAAAQPANPAIQAWGLTKVFDKVRAVDGITFEVKRGEIFGLLGPNGAGKTTTIRMLTGLSKPTCGSARVLGFDVSSESARVKKGIGVVPEMSNLYDELSVTENLLFMAQLYGVPRRLRRRKAEELLRAFGLSERRNQLFRKLSRGMKRALTIAAALVHDPEVLFLDEPTVGLDVMAARSLRSLVGRLRSRGMTIFLTTHYLEEADLLCDRIAILVKGRIVKVDTPAALKAMAEGELVLEVAFRGTEALVEGELHKLRERLPGARVIGLNNHRVRIYGGEASRVLERVLEFARERGVKLESVSTVRPTLEDAFVKIAGLDPLVMAVEKGGKA